MRRTMQRRKPWRFSKARFGTVHSLLSAVRAPQMAPHYTALDLMELRASLQRHHRAVRYEVVKRRKPT